MVSTLAVLVAVLCLYSGKSFYRQQVPKGSPLARILQVFVVAIINRNLPLPETTDGFHDVKLGTGDEILKKTEQFSK